MKLYGSGNNRKARASKTPVFSRDYRYGDDYSDYEDEKSPEELEAIDELIYRYQRKKIIKRLVILSIIIAVFGGTFLWFRSTVKPPDIGASDSGKTDNSAVSAPGSALNLNSANRKKDFYTFAVVGNDNGYGNTDTMIVGSYDAKNKKLTMVNIPRDTLVNVPWSVKKANTIMSFSDNEIEGLNNGIRDIVGFAVDNYIIVDMEAFVRLVDAVGGVSFYVPLDMDYDDPAQDFHVHLSEGMQWLDGEDAIGVVRFRQNNDGSGYPAADIQRIATQQDFLKALSRQILQIGNVTKINEFATIFKDYVDTDLDWGNTVWYGIEFLGLKEEDILFFTLPENYNDSVKGFSYCTIILDDWLEMINTYLNPYNTEIKAENLNILTRDADGNLYATTGSIAGGYDSFADYYAMFGEYSDDDYYYEASEDDEFEDDTYEDDISEDDTYEDGTSEDGTYEDGTSEDDTYEDDVSGDDTAEPEDSPDYEEPSASEEGSGEDEYMETPEAPDVAEETGGG